MKLIDSFFDIIKCLLMGIGAALLAIGLDFGTLTIVSSSIIYFFTSSGVDFWGILDLPMYGTVIVSGSIGFLLGVYFFIWLALKGTSEKKDK